eukprot:scpid38807/ scgid13745/ Transmembrane protease serine 11D; Airway trypsin-like protease; Transmembrane protease serine 11D non-catalytic chain; Transmembrane protease serine 11D catalytic chain
MYSWPLCIMVGLMCFLELSTGETVDVSTVPCTWGGRPGVVPTMRFPSTQTRQVAVHHVVLRPASQCLCGSAYRFVAKVTGRRPGDQAARVEVCFNDISLRNGDRLILKRHHMASGHRRNILALSEQGQIGSPCREVSLLYREVLELRFKVSSTCAQQLSGDAPGFNVTFRYLFRQVTCNKPQPGALPNGIITPENVAVFSPGDLVRFECRENHSLVGDDRWYSTCGKDGEWSTPVPRCSTEEEWCPMVSLDIAHAAVSVPASRSVGSVLRVSCASGYFLHGQPHYTCRNDGTWQSAYLMHEIECSRQVNCPVPEDDGDVIVEDEIYPGFLSFAKHCCRPGLEGYGCGPGRMCDRCVSRICLRDTHKWSGTPPKCRAVQPLWTRLYNSLFQPALESNTALASTRQSCQHQDDSESDHTESGDHNASAVAHTPLVCSRSITQDLRGCYDLAFLLDASRSISDDVFFNTSLPFVRVVTNYFTIGAERARVSVVLFQKTSVFLLEQANDTRRVYRTLGNITRPKMGNTNLRFGFENFIRRVALDLYNGSSAHRRQCKKVMFVLSDGEINDGGTPEEAASTLKELGWEIYAIALGQQWATQPHADFASIASLPHYEYIFKLAYQSQNQRRQCGCTGQPKKVARHHHQENIEEFVRSVVPVKGNYEECGRPNSPLSGYTGRERIIGGKEARFGAYPWQVALASKRTGKIFCSGTLICKDNCKWVLTAAHCFRDRTRRIALRAEDVVVRFGENDVTVLEGSEFECDIRRIMFGKGYNGRPEDGNDIAMVLPACSFDLSAQRRCACLPEGPADQALMTAGSLVEIAGWGARSLNGHVKSASHVLRWAQLRIVSRRRCQKSHRLLDSMVCAGGDVDSNGDVMDSCSGDSGGALVARRKDDSFVVLAVLSYGQVNPDDPRIVCGQPGYYGVYTSIHASLPWIKQKMESVLGCSR